MSISDYGATHYMTMKDGVTPQMAYKQERIKFNDGTFKDIWVYLSFCDIWMGSGITDEKARKLVRI